MLVVQVYNYFSNHYMSVILEINRKMGKELSALQAFRHRHKHVLGKVHACMYMYNVYNIMLYKYP